MAIKALVKTKFGEERELYIRLNNLSASNHGVSSSALFRGFVSQDQFKAGGHYIWEMPIKFNADVAAPIWEQAYQHLKSLPEISSPVDC